MTAAHSPTTGIIGHASRALAAAVAAVVLLGICWGVEVVDYADGGILERYGIRPRDPATIWHIFTAPFLHHGLDHIMANSMPLMILAFLTALRGLLRFVVASLIVILVSGLGVWILTVPNSLTVGASGLIFGYFGYLLARGLFERRLFDVVIGVVVAGLYGTMIFSALPNQPGISWQAHMFGLIGGVFAAWILRHRTADRLLTT